MRNDRAVETKPVADLFFPKRLKDTLHALVITHLAEIRLAGEHVGKEREKHV